MQMQIGPFRFDVATGTEYAELKRHARRRWLARERFGQPPALKDLGRDAETITVRGTVWVRAAADLAALAALRTAAGVDPDGAAPEPLPVYLGGGPGASGVFLGAWAVTRLAETERTLRADGAPTRVDFTVTLQEAAP